MKKFSVAFLPLLFAGCALLGYGSKLIATFEQKEGWQVIEKSIDILGEEHEIAFAFHGHKCEKEISGHGYVEVFYADGERVASASFSLSDLVFPGAEDTSGLLCDPVGYLLSNGSRPLAFISPRGTKTLTFRIGIHGFKSDDATYLDIWSTNHYSKIPRRELKKLRRERMVKTTDLSRSR